MSSKFYLDDSSRLNIIETLNHGERVTASTAETTTMTTLRVSESSSSSVTFYFEMIKEEEGSKEEEEDSAEEDQTASIKDSGEEWEEEYSSGDSSDDCCDQPKRRCETMTSSDIAQQDEAEAAMRKMRRIEEMVSVLRGKNNSLGDKARLLYLFCEKCLEEDQVIEYKVTTNCERKNRRTAGGSFQGDKVCTLDLTPEEVQTSPVEPLHTEKRKSIFKFAKFSNRNSVIVEPEENKFLSPQLIKKLPIVAEILHEKANNVKKSKKKTSKRNAQSILLENEAEAIKRHSRRSQSEGVLDDVTLQFLSVKLFRDCLESSEQDYFHSLYAMISLYKMKQFLEILRVLRELSVFKNISSYLKTFLDEDSSIHPANDHNQQHQQQFREQCSLAKSIISFFAFIVFMCRLHSYSDLYINIDVIEIVDMVTDDTLFQLLQENDSEDNVAELSQLESLKQMVEKEIASHGVRLTLEFGTEFKNIATTDLDSDILVDACDPAQTET